MGVSGQGGITSATFIENYSISQGALSPKRWYDSFFIDSFTGGGQITVWATSAAATGAATYDNLNGLCHLEVAAANDRICVGGDEDYNMNFGYASAIDDSISMCKMSWRMASTVKSPSNGGVVVNVGVGDDMEGGYLSCSFCILLCSTGTNTMAIQTKTAAGSWASANFAITEGDYHTYEIRWNASKLEFYIDGVEQGLTGAIPTDRIPSAANVFPIAFLKQNALTTGTIDLYWWAGEFVQV